MAVRRASAPKKKPAPETTKAAKTSSVALAALDRAAAWTPPLVEAAFARYETALVCNDVDTLQSLFWNSPLTLRYGIGEILHGWDEIGAFRSARSPAGLNRVISRTVITTVGGPSAE